MDSLREPLELSAPIARRLASALCRRDPATGESCAWYHGLWQFLRLMRLVDPLERHAEFFATALEPAAGGRGAPRVLISGTADYAMLAHVLAASRGRGAVPSVTVLDRCETPLELNRWYAARVASPVETVCCDILDFAAPGFDAICTHAFLGRFAPRQRPGLLERWRLLLRPGGRVVTVTPVRAGDAAVAVGFSPRDAALLREAVQRGAEALEPALSADAHDLVRDADAYAARHRVYRVRSHEELIGLFEQSGFRVVHHSRVLPAAADGAIHGPTMTGSAEYARIVAVRI